MWLCYLHASACVNDESRVVQRIARASPLFGIDAAEIIPPRITNAASPADVQPLRTRAMLKA
jgi:hypothetical protein